MKNMLTKDFCKKFDACPRGAKFAADYERMHECYVALLEAKAGDHSAEWAIWVALQKGVFPDRPLQQFAIACLRNVHSVLLVAMANTYERHLNGELSEEDLIDSGLKQKSIADRVWLWASQAAEFTAAAYARARQLEGSNTPWRDWSVGWCLERREQLKLLAKLGNPFTEAC